ncbi:MAG: gliding motility-associated C-terminal domain-containing protein [Bacteroidota bacterium]
MKRFIFSFITIFLFLLTVINHAQVINPAIINVPSGTYMNVQMDLFNYNTGIVNNAGTIILSGDYSNDGVFNSASNSFMNMIGPFQNIGGINSTTFSNLVIDGTDNKQCNISTTVAEDLKFNNNKIIIGNNDLFLLSLATITSPDSNKFIVTNGSGSLIKDDVPIVSDFLFPVGDATNSYKPVTLYYSGVNDTFAVRVAPGLLPATTADNECVQYTYFVKENNDGGTNASLKLGWSTNNEGSSFVRAQSYMWQYNNSSWNILPGTPGASSNLPATKWYYKTSGINDFSATSYSFIVRSYLPLTLNSQSSSQSTCENNTVTFSVTASGSDIQYQWQENCGSGWSDISDDLIYSGAQTSDLTISNAGPGIDGCMYQCIMENLLDTVTSQAVMLTVHATPLAYAGQDTTIMAGTTLQLNATGGLLYQWIPSTDLDNPNIPDPISSTLENISYVVFVTDTFGCTASDTINITVDESADIFIPDIFSPNDDGQNDILYVRGHGIKELDFVVFDRWGEKVFETTDINNGWDGTYKGDKLFTAVFAYYIKVSFYDGNNYEGKGNITLVR